MRGLVYLDHNILSEGDDPNIVWLIKAISEHELAPVISWLHLLEMNRSPQWEKYLPRLSGIRPALLQTTPSENEPSHKRSIIFDYDIEALVEDFRSESFRSLSGMLSILSLFQKSFGGLDSYELSEIASFLIDELRSSVRYLSRDLKGDEQVAFGMVFGKKVEESANLVRILVPEMDFAAQYADISDIRAALKSDGGIHQLPAKELIPRIIHLTRDTSASHLFESFPNGFARRSKNPQFDICGFAFSIAAMGGVPGLRGLVSGELQDKSKPVVSQFLDCAHIGEAAATEMFLTMDKGAARLGSAIFDYAGVQTRSSLLVRNK